MSDNGAPSNDYPTIRLTGIDCIRGRKILLTDVNIELPTGQVTALIGPNGAGKSTLISTIVGDIGAGAGEVTLDGIPVKQLPSRSLTFGLVAESHGLPKDMKVSAILDYWAAVHSTNPRLRDTLVHQMGVNTFLKTKIGKLSTGMRRRLELTLALLPQPPVIILDEPFNGLDIEGIETLRETIRYLCDNKKTVLLSTHTLSEVDQLAGQTYAVHGNRLIKLEFDKGVAGASEAAYRSLREGGKPS